MFDISIIKQWWMSVIVATFTINVGSNMLKLDISIRRIWKPIFNVNFYFIFIYYFDENQCFINFFNCCCCHYLLKYLFKTFKLSVRGKLYNKIDRYLDSVKFIFPRHSRGRRVKEHWTLLSAHFHTPEVHSHNH